MDEKLINECKRLNAIISAGVVKTTEVVNDDYCNDYENDCKHSQSEEINGNVFCVDCGEVFEDETAFYQIGQPSKHKSNDLLDDHLDDHTHDQTDEQKDHHLGRDEQHSETGECSEQSAERSERSEEQSEQRSAEEPELPTSANDLRKLAKERGVKYYSRMNKKELCEVLKTGLAVKPHKVVFTNKETGEQHGFQSLNQASIEMKVNPGLIAYYNEKDEGMKIGETTYLVKRT